MIDKNDVIIAVEDETWPSGIILRPGALTWKSDVIPIVAGFDVCNLIGKTTAIRRVGNEIHATIKFGEDFANAFDVLTDFSFSYLIDRIECSSEDQNIVTKARLKGVAIIPSLKFPED